MEWAKFQERERKKEEEEKEKERVAYAQIDWHDFVVVETVDFQPNEQGRSRRRVPFVWKPGSLVLLGATEPGTDFISVLFPCVPEVESLFICPS